VLGTDEQRYLSLPRQQQNDAPPTTIPWMTTATTFIATSPGDVSFFLFCFVKFIIIIIRFYNETTPTTNMDDDRNNFGCYLVSRQYDFLLC
jgi:hypothetical protein